MGKRFGRNQRRALRQQVERALDTADSWKASYDGASRRAYAAEKAMYEWAREMLSLAGENSAFNAYLKTVTQKYPVGFLNLLPGNTFGMVPMYSTDLPIAACAQHVIEAAILYARVYQDEVTRRVHVRVESEKGKTLGYALDERTMQKWTPRVIANVSEMIANKLAEHLETSE